MKKISVIVPVYNVEQYLERMLSSLLKQTYYNLEIILVDDGSTDNSGKICDEYKSIDKRIKVVHQKNSGVSVARNTGIELATGDYIGFVDSDDVVCESMYERLYNNMVNNNCEISVCSYDTFDKVPQFECIEGVNMFSFEDAIKDIISDGVITNFLWNKLFKKNLFDGIKFPEGKIYEDMYVMPKLLERASKLCFDNSKLYGYFVRQNSYVNTYNKRKNINYLTFSDSCYDYLKKYDFLKEDLEKYRLFYIYSAYLQAAKSNCKDIFSDEFTDSYYIFYKDNFKLNTKYSYKRKALSWLLYINKSLFYKVVNLLK